MNVQRLTAFATEQGGGNPAGVVIEERSIPEPEMRRIAREVGYSETAFAVREESGNADWRVRYFSPSSEVPFCGHATIALGATLAQRFGNGRYSLRLNDSTISVEGVSSPTGMSATLHSPPTSNAPVPKTLLQDALDLFGYDSSEIDDSLPPALINGGGNHLLLAVKHRETLARMRYDLARGKKLMDSHGLVTIDLVFVRNHTTFDARNPFASGGVYEDPATGAAAAALAGYLRDIDWPMGDRIDIYQGEDMGHPSHIVVQPPESPGGSAGVSGLVRPIE
ncbi:MAG: PhzF family phenazine biosynthesis protein [Alkalispirochaeta sp.]